MRFTNTSCQRRLKLLQASALARRRVNFIVGRTVETMKEFFWEFTNDTADLYINLSKSAYFVAETCLQVVILIVIFITSPIWVGPFLWYRSHQKSAQQANRADAEQTAIMAHLSNQEP